MVRRDPFTPDQRRYECRDCDYGMTAASHQPTCPSCGGEVRNVVTQ